MLFLCFIACLFIPRGAVSLPALTANESDGKCHCRSEMTINIPPCTCTGLVEAMNKNYKLQEEMKELQSNCTVDGVGSAMPYKSTHVMVEGVRWTRFWWYTPTNGWPSGVTDVLGVPYGACTTGDTHCFGRLPGALEEGDSELLAIDSAGTIYRWRFDPTNPTAHHVWNAFYHHIESRHLNGRPWDPHVVAGPTPNAAQDSFMYRVQNGVRSLMLDDENCDGYTTLSMGHGMCHNGFPATYGPSGRFGVDLLYDTYSQTPDPKQGLSLYFRDDDDCKDSPCAEDQECVDKVNDYICV